MININIYESAARKEEIAAQAVDAPAPKDAVMNGGSQGVSPTAPEITVYDTRTDTTGGPAPSLFNGLPLEGSMTPLARPDDTLEFGNAIAPAPSIKIDLLSEENGPEPTLRLEGVSNMSMDVPAPSFEPNEENKGVKNAIKEDPVKKK